MSDAIEFAAMARAMAVSADLIAQIENKTGLRPMLAILARAKHEACQAMTELVLCRFDDADRIRQLQNEIVRFDNLLKWSKDVLDEGDAAFKAVSLDDQNAIQLLLSTPEGRHEAAELGITEVNDQ